MKRNNEKLINRYCNYSIKKIILKTDKYLKSIDITYKNLSTLSPIFENNPAHPYHVYLQKQFNKVKQTKNILGLNNLYNNNTVINNRIENNNNTLSNMYINQKNEGENYVQNLNNSNRQEIQVNMNNKPYMNENQIKFLEENFETSRNIRKYCKSLHNFPNKKNFKKNINFLGAKLKMLK